MQKYALSEFSTEYEMEKSPSNRTPSFATEMLANKTEVDARLFQFYDKNDRQRERKWRRKTYGDVTQKLYEQQQG